MQEMQEMLEIQRYRDGKITALQDAVVVERLVSLRINNEITIHHSMSPALYREFATGFILTSGMVTSPGDISQVLVDGDTINVHVRNLQVPNASGKGVGGGWMPLDITKKKTPLHLLRLDLKILESLFGDFSQRSAIFRQTGGIHSAALSDGSQVVCFVEDIGRHNAVDKVVGMAILAGKDLSGLVLLTSGRISAEIVNKAYQVRIPGVVSHSAPTSLAVQMGTRYGMRLVGFLRGNRFNIYA
ncbi:MAG TPA: formate dehydrogenase accessory sulfurtransferase FdhD [Candidatus Aminicenantes bacterium]|nr:formate dehydrogenase accessory sulfurtransferase FdhD [Candidatus Aminicenantes bacterium]